MPHCLGALDGKHVGIRKPASCGSLWYNCKRFFSIVLLGICDARYCFSYVDVGEDGSNNDSRVLKNSRMGRKFGANKMNIPSPAKISKSDDLELPYFLLGDEILPLSNWLMRPYSGKALTSETRKIFNYRLSRARRVIEKTFSILVARWRVLQKPIDAKPERVEKTIPVAITLHNYLRQTDNACYTPNGLVGSEDNNGNIVPGQWRSILHGNSLQFLRPIRNHKYTRTAIETREALANYLAADGSVSWQLDYIRRTGNE